MARMTRCAVCKKCELPGFKCEIYREGIPRDIFVEEIDCEYYELRPPVKHLGDEDLPLAKGR